MSNETVKAALASGVAPIHICQTCGWDQMCIKPPAMTAQDVQDKQAESIAKMKAEADEKKDGAVIGALMATIMFAGKDTEAKVCPLVANALRDHELGPRIAGAIRSIMRDEDPVQP